MTRSSGVLLRGSEVEPVVSRELKAGPLTVLYHAGDLRYIRLGEREIIRRIYFALRTPTWGTAPNTISDLWIDDRGDSFGIRYQVHCVLGDMDFLGHIAIDGSHKGDIQLVVEGKAQGTFETSRIGFCVLHPIAECAGTPCRIEHVDGSVETRDFPELIEPQIVENGVIMPVPSFSEMRSMSHQVVPGLTATVRFPDDAFETEDQRNWTDASYKSYGPPLSEPWPFTLEQGEKVRRSINLALKGKVPANTQKGSAPVAISMGAQPVLPLPAIGLGASGHRGALSAEATKLLRELSPSHIHVDYVAGQPDCREALQQAAAEATRIGAPLQIAVFLSEQFDEELAELAGLLSAIAPTIATCFVFRQDGSAADPDMIKKTIQHLASLAPSATFGGGSGNPKGFVGLNRKRPEEPSDVVTYRIVGQIHAFDDFSIMETLEAQADTVRSARALSGDATIAVGPISLLGSPAGLREAGEIPAEADPRQKSLCAAAWTLGSVKYLAEAGASALTYYETTGCIGVMPAEGGVFPVYHVLADIQEFVGGTVEPVTSSHPLSMIALALAKDGRHRTLMSNLTDQEQTVQVPVSPSEVMAKRLDLASAEIAMIDPEGFRGSVGERMAVVDGQVELVIGPYATCRLDGLEAE